MPKSKRHLTQHWQTGWKCVTHWCVGWMAQMIITEHMTIIIYRLPPLHHFPPTLWTQMFKINLTCTSASFGALWEVWGEGSVSSDSPVGNPGLVHTSFHPLHDEIQQDFHSLAHVMPVCSTRLKIRDSVLLGEFTSLVFTDHSLVRQVTFVPTQNDVRIFTVCMDL